MKKGFIIFIFVLVLLVAGIFFKTRTAEPVIPEGWLSVTTPEISFSYPATLHTSYIHPVDWPPQVLLSKEPFSCTEAGEATERAGKTERRVIGEREYCVTEVVEGAAGSTYTQYSYITTMKEGTINLLFTTRASQCGNYDSTQAAVCEDERNLFSADEVARGIVETIR